MKFGRWLVTTVFVFVPALLLFPQSVFASWQYYRNITVSSVAQGTQTNFPLYVHIPPSDSLKFTSSGGHVQDVHGYDIIFTASYDCTNPLHFVRHSYSPSTGEFTARVNVPTLSANARIYLCYGNPDITTDQSSANTTDDASLIGYWPLNEGSGATAHDISGNNGDGILGCNNTGCSNPAWSFAGPAQNVSLNFDNSNIVGNQYIVLPSAPPYNQATNVSLSAWIYPTQVTSGTIFEFLTWDPLSPQYSTFTGMAFYFSDGLFQLNFNGGGTPTLTASSGPSASVWQLVTATYDANSGTETMYLNGTAIGSRTVLQPLVLHDNSNILGFMQWNGVPYYGNMSDVRVYNRTLSPEWLQNEYHNVNSPSSFYAISSEGPYGSPDISLSASPSVVTPADTSVTLTWNTLYADTVSIDQGIGSVIATSSGSIVVSPAISTIYTLSAGNSYGTSTVQATVTVVPTSPTNLIATVHSPTEVGLSWNPSVAASSVAGYKIYRCAGTSCEPTIQVGTSSNTLYTDTLSRSVSSTTYRYRVAAFDTEGNTSSLSGYVTAIIPPSPMYPASDVLGQMNLDGSGNFDTSDSTSTARGMSWPNGLVLDSMHHRLFVANCGYDNTGVFVYNLSATNDLVNREAVAVLGRPDFLTMSTSTDERSIYYCSEGPSYDPVHDRLFVVDWYDNRVLVFDLSQGVTNGMSASYVLGQPNFTSGSINQGGSASSISMRYPSKAFYDHTEERLFVTDGNSRILVFDLSHGITNGMPASYVLGQPNFTSGSENQGGSAASTTMNYPYAIHYDQSNHRLFVDDDSNNRILVFDLSHGITNGMPASYVLGQPDMTTVNKTTISARESRAYFAEQLTYDPINERLFVGDDGASRILVFDLSGGVSNYMAASGVIGAPDFITNGWAPNYNCYTSRSNICDPEVGMDYDPGNNRLWMTDNSNNRVLAFDFVKIQGDLSGGTQGTTYAQTLSTSGSQGTVSFTVASGTLPAGLTLNTSSGLISGNPTTPGAYTFTVKATDDNGAIGWFSDKKEFTLTITSPSIPGSGSSSYYGCTNPLASNYNPLANSDDGSCQLPNSSGGGNTTPASTTTPLASSITPVIPPPVSATTTASTTTPAVTEGYRPTLILPLSQTEPTPPLPPPTVLAPLLSQTTSLPQGAKSPAIRSLQAFLNTQGFTVAQSGPGSPGNESPYFGRLTKLALIKFQEAHAKEILTPLHLTHGTGILGPMTLRCIQKLAK